MGPETCENELAPMIEMLKTSGHELIIKFSDLSNLTEDNRRRVLREMGVNFYNVVIRGAGCHDWLEARNVVEIMCLSGTILRIVENNGEISEAGISPSRNVSEGEDPLQVVQEDVYRIIDGL